MRKSRAAGMKRICLLLAFVIAMMGLFTGCGGGEDTEKTSDTMVFSDDVGRQVELPAEIEHVATLGTTSQIIMMSLSPDMLVGINAPIEKDAEEYMGFDYSSLPVIGQYYGQRNLNLEEVANLDADVIIDLGDTKENSAEDMDEIQNQTGIPTIHINATMETSPDAFRKLGKLLGREERAEELAACCESISEKTEKVLGKVGEDKKLKILSCSGSDGMTVVAKGSSHSELIDIIGTNVAEVTGNSGTVDIEQIYIWDPDVILFSEDSIYDEVSDMPDWQGLTAIEKNHYYEIPNGPYCWTGSPPTVNRYLGLLWLTSELYPQECDYDLQKEVTEYYKVFYGCDLTDAQYDSLMKNAAGGTW